MAKIGTLQVTQLKIVDGSLETYYRVTGSGSSALNLTVTTASNNPTILFGWCWSSNCIILRTRGNKYIGSGEGVPPDGSTAFIGFDDDPINGDVYQMTGQLGTSPLNELSAVVKLK